MDHILHAGLSWASKELLQEAISAASPPFNPSEVEDREDLIVFEDHDGSLKRVWRVWRVKGGGICVEGRMFFSSSSPQKKAVMDWVDSKSHACFKYSKGDLSDNWKAAIGGKDESRTSKRYDGPDAAQMKSLLGLLLKQAWNACLVKLIFDDNGNMTTNVSQGGGEWSADTFFNRTKAKGQKDPYKYSSYGRIYVTNSASGKGALKKAVKLCRF